jgi:hypothetical protein
MEGNGNLAEISMNAWGVEMARSAFGAATHQDWAEEVYNRALTHATIVAACVGNKQNPSNSVTATQDLKCALITLSASMIEHLVRLLKNASTDHWSCQLKFDLLKPFVSAQNLEILDELTATWSDFIRYMIESPLSAEALMVDPRFVCLQTYFVRNASKIGHVIELGGGGGGTTPTADTAVGASIRTIDRRGPTFRRMYQEGDTGYTFGVDPRDVPLATFEYDGFDNILVSPQASFHDIVNEHLRLLYAAKKDKRLTEVMVDQIKNFGRLLFNGIVRPGLNDQTPAEVEKRRDICGLLNKLDQALTEYARLSINPNSALNKPIKEVGKLIEKVQQPDDPDYKALWTNFALAVADDRDDKQEAADAFASALDNFIRPKLDDFYWHGSRGNGAPTRSQSAWPAAGDAAVGDAFDLQIEGKIGGPKMDTTKWKVVSALALASATFGSDKKRTFFFPTDEAIKNHIDSFYPLSTKRGSEFLNYLIDNPKGKSQQRFFTWLVNIGSCGKRLEKGTETYLEENTRKFFFNQRASSMTVTDLSVIPNVPVPAQIVAMDSADSLSRPVIHIINKVLNLDNYNPMKIKLEDVDNYSIGLRWLINTPTLTKQSEPVMIPDNQAIKHNVDPDLYRILSNGDIGKRYLSAREFFWGHFLMPGDPRESNVEPNTWHTLSALNGKFESTFITSKNKGTVKSVAVAEKDNANTTFKFSLDEATFYTEPRPANGRPLPGEFTKEKETSNLMKRVFGVTRYDGPAVCLVGYQIHPLATVAETASKRRNGIIAKMFFDDQLLPSRSSDDGGDDKMAFVVSKIDDDGNFDGVGISIEDIGASFSPAIVAKYSIGMKALAAANISTNQTVVLIEDRFWKSVFKDHDDQLNKLAEDVAASETPARQFLDLYTTKTRIDTVDKLRQKMGNRKTASGVIVMVIDGMMGVTKNGRTVLLIKRDRNDALLLKRLSSKDNKNIPVVWGASDDVDISSEETIDQILKNNKPTLVRNAKFPVPQAVADPNQMAFVVSKIDEDFEAVAEEVGLPFDQLSQKFSKNVMKKYSIGMTALSSADIPSKSTVILIEDHYWRSLFAGNETIFDKFVEKLATDKILARRFLGLMTISSRVDTIERLKRQLGVRKTESGVIVTVADALMGIMKQGKTGLIIQRNTFESLALSTLSDKNDRSIPMVWGAFLDRDVEIASTKSLIQVMLNSDKKVIKGALFPVPSSLRATATTTTPVTAEPQLFEKILRFSELKDPNTGKLIADSPNWTLIVPSDVFARVERNPKVLDSSKREWGGFIEDPNSLKLSDNQVSLLLTSKSAARQFINAHLVPGRFPGSRLYNEGYANPSIRSTTAGPVFGKLFKTIRTRDEKNADRTMVFISGDIEKNPFEYLAVLGLGNHGFTYVPVHKIDAIINDKSKPVVHFIKSWLVDTEQFLDDGKTAASKPPQANRRSVLKKKFFGGANGQVFVNDSQEDVSSFLQGIGIAADASSPSTTVFLLDDQVRAQMNLETLGGDFFSVAGRWETAESLHQNNNKPQQGSVVLYRHGVSGNLILTKVDKASGNTFDFRVTNNEMPLWKSPLGGMPVVYAIHPLNEEEISPLLLPHNDEIGDCCPTAPKISLCSSALIGMDLIRRSCLLGGHGLCKGRFFTLVLPNDESWLANESAANDMLSDPSLLRKKMEHFVFGSDSRSLTHQDLLDISRSDSPQLTSLDHQSVLLSCNGQILYVRKTDECQQHKVVSSTHQVIGDRVVEIHVVNSMF